ncbi:MAG: hypothetical protein RIR00_521 [Pseudomonadota bacterium]|jgi:hypothetical protein
MRQTLTQSLRGWSLALALGLIAPLSQAGGLADLSEKDSSAGLREALSKGADYAVSTLGQAGGFAGNPKVKIELPDSLHAAEKALRTFGKGAQADELVATMNKAAETAVVQAKPVLLNAIKQMSVQDAKGILTGGEDAATQYFKRTTSGTLNDKFLPIVKQATAKVQLADKYNSFAGKAANFGLVDKQDANLDGYVTRKTLDGLFLMVAEQEKAIRKDPIGTGSALLGKVFGSLR